MLAAPSGAAGFVTRHPTAALSAVLVLTGIITGPAAALAFSQSLSLLDPAVLALGAVLAAGISFWHTRHPVLAVLTAVTPLPGLILAAPLAAGASFGLVPFVAYGFGFALATLTVQHVLDRLLCATMSEAPWRAAGVVLGLAILLAIVWFRHSDNADAAMQAVGDLLAVSASVLLLLPVLMARVHFDEAYVADANRVHERRGRTFERLGGASLPRWGLSLTGIAIIFLALGWFGAAPVVQGGWWRYGATVVLVCGAFGAFAGGWREGLGLGFVGAVSCLAALWWQTYARVPFGAVGAFEVAMLASFLSLSSARQMRAWRRAGDASDMARRRALEEPSGAIFATLGATAAALPSLLHAGAQVIVLAVLAAGLCGAILLPAVLTGIEAVFPRWQSLQEMYGRTRRT
jgi:hypothetical protein